MRLNAAVIAILLLSGPLVLVAGAPDAAAVPIQAQIDILTSVNWTTGTSPVHVAGNVTVHEGGVLTILEGTEVLFDEGTHISVEGGKLFVQGTPAAPVRFLPNSTGPWKGFYEWIYVTSTPTGQATVSVSWAELSFGVKGFYLDGVQGARFDNVRFNSTAEAGIYIGQCSGAAVRYCTFSDIDGHGIWAEGSDNLSLSDNLYSGCAGTSVLLSSCEYSSVTSSTLIAGQSERGVALVDSAGILVDSLVVEDAPTGLELAGSSNNTVFSCLFSKNGVGLSLNSSPGNLFRGNNFTGCGLPLSFSGGLEIASNVFELSNFIDGLPVRAIKGGNLDDVSAGAVVLLDCPGSVVSNITFPPGGGAVIVLFGGAVTLRDLSLNGPAGSVTVLGSNGIVLENVSVTGPARRGMTLWGTQGAGIRDCRVSGCEAGITFLGPLNMSVSRTTLENDPSDLELSSESNVLALDCSFATVAVDESSRLDEAYSLAVSVQDTNGSGLAGADILVREGAKARYATTHFGGIDPPSGSKGDFKPIETVSAVHLAAGRTDIETTVEVWNGADAFEWNPRTFWMSAPTAAVFRATVPGFLAGHVLDPAGDPVAGVDIRLDSGQNATTGADGGFRFAPLSPGNYSMNASCPGWASLDVPVIPVAADETAYANLTMEAAPGSTGELSGAIINDTGAPVAGALVSTAGGPSSVTDAAGVFNVSGAPGGWVNFTVAKVGFLDGSDLAFVPPNGRSRPVTLTLAAATPGAAGGISVQVVDIASGPLLGARVWLDQDIEMFLLSPANGTCLFPDVKAGLHRVSASLSGYGPSSLNVTVIDGSIASIYIVLFQEGAANGSLSGRVRTAAGAAIQGAVVHLEELNLSATSDAAGNYSFASLPAGLHNVTASAAGHSPETVMGVAVLGGTVTTLDLVLGPVRTFSNRTLGVSVSGVFEGDGRLVIRRAPAPPVLPPGGFNRFFEIRAEGFTCMTGLRITVTGQLFLDSLSGRDLSMFEIRVFTHPSGEWDPGERWEVVEESGYDAGGGFFWADVAHFSVFGIGFAPRGGPTGTTIVALPPWLSPIAVVALVLVVAVPIGIIVIRVRQPPSGGGRQNTPVPPPRQPGVNL